MFNIRFSLPVVLFVCSIAPAAASDSEIDRASLKGLQGVFVLVEELNPAEEQAGLKSADIQTDAEQILRTAGIPLLSKTQSIDAPGMPTLYISVSVASSAATDLWPFSIDVNLEQQATLKRSPDTYDLIFVDGNHSEAGAYFDIVCSLPRLTERGIIVLHDFNNPDDPTPGIAAGEYGVHWALHRLRSYIPDCHAIQLRTITLPGATSPVPTSLAVITRR